MAFHDACANAECHECGREMATAKKVHAGKRYCEACYRRLFKRRMCLGCGDFARLPIFDLSARCSTCERSAACVRCGRFDFETGMRSDYGLVCKTCTPYFRIAEPCEVCGTSSQRLARNKVTGLKSCPKCSGPEMATCPSCRRYRVLVAGEDGVSRCEPCSAMSTNPCDTCGAPTPAGRGRECETCYWLRLFHKRLATNAKGFSSDQIAGRYARFGQWLLDRTGAHKAALSINGHYRFFLVLDTTWGSVPSYERLVQHFGAAGLRRAESPMRWLTELGEVVVNVEIREQLTEQRRLEAILAEPADSWSAQLLKEYVAALKGKMEHSGTDLRSIRLAARAAANLLKSAQLKLGAMPSQKALESFWRGAPGQVAAVTGFVGHLNKHHGLELKAKPDPRWLAGAKRQKAERELVALLSEVAHETFEERWIVKGLAYFHGVMRASRKSLVYQPQDYRGVAGFNVTYEQQVLWVPSASSYQRGDHSD